MFTLETVPCGCCATHGRVHLASKGLLKGEVKPYASFTSNSTNSSTPTPIAPNTAHETSSYACLASASAAPAARRGASRAA
eukprot:4467173-Pleurochrysis_carterae.AAC.4